MKTADLRAVGFGEIPGCSRKFQFDEFREFLMAHLEVRHGMYVSRGGVGSNRFSCAELSTRAQLQCELNFRASSTLCELNVRTSSTSVRAQLQYELNLRTSSTPARAQLHFERNSLYLSNFSSTSTFCTCSTLGNALRQRSV